MHLLPFRRVLSNRLRWLLLVFGVVFAGSLAPQPAQGQGFSVYEQGSCTMAMAGAAVANPCGDASALFFNPAGLVDTEGVTISAGATVIAAQGSFTADYTGEQTELQNSPIPVPHLYGAWRATPDLAVGLGVYVPYGLETEWPKNWDGAFEGYDNGVESIYIQPTVAYKITDRIRVGGGPILGIGSVTLNQLIDVSQQEVPSDRVPEGTTFGDFGIPHHTAFADASLEGSGALGYGGHVGITVRATDRIQFGARYVTPVKFDYEGEATFEQVQTGLQLPANNPLTGGNPVSLDFLLESSFVSGSGPLVTQSLETSLTMPAQFVAGVSVEPFDGLLLLADYQWAGWSSFDTISLDFEKDVLDRTRTEGFENTHAVRLGTSYDLTETFTLRAGYLFNQSAAPDRTVTPLLPEANRNHVTAGLGWRATDIIELNVAYQYLGQNDRRGRVRGERVGEEDPTVEELNSGLYSFHAHLIGTTLTIHL
jgi:long-chain fatty acid transport protein